MGIPTIPRETFSTLGEPLTGISVSNLVVESEPAPSVQSGEMKMGGMAVCESCLNVYG